MGQRQSHLPSDSSLDRASEGVCRRVIHLQYKPEVYFHPL